MLLHSTDINAEQQEDELGEITLYTALTNFMTVKSEDTINKYKSMTPNATSSSMQIPRRLRLQIPQPAPSTKFCMSFSSSTF
jgi:hypothetical protein